MTVWREILYVFFGHYFILGRSRIEALKRAQELEKQGYGVTINFLGEHYMSEQKVRKAVLEYCALIVALAHTLANPRIALKPSQIGTAISAEYFMKNLACILRSAAYDGVSVEVDIEEPHTAEQTIARIVTVAQNLRYKKIVRIAIAASMPNIEAIIKKYSLHEYNLRLVKGGIYQDNDQIRDTEKVYNRFIHLGFSFTAQRSGREPDCYFATIRDRALVRCMINTFPDPRFLGKWKFQMLYGPWKKLPRELLAKGYPIVIYAPYGNEWISYGLRRWKFLAKLCINKILPHAW